MRRLFLWAARNAWLRDHLPRMRFMRRAVRRFMPGEQLADALAAAEAHRRDGIASVFTLLGENLTTIDDADRVAAHYHLVLDEIATRGLDAEISVKPTQLGLDLEPEATFAHVAALARHAAASAAPVAATRTDHGGCRSSRRPALDDGVATYLLSLCQSCRSRAARRRMAAHAAASRAHR